MSQDPFCNSNLFSNHYLLKLIKETPEWKDGAHLSEIYREIKTIFGQKPERFKNFPESMLEEILIRPILKKLGHNFSIQQPIHNTPFKPDYGFFSDQSSLEEAYEFKESSDFYSKAIAVGDAKAWKVSLDKTNTGAKIKGGSFEMLNPSYQIDFYLRATPPKWAILANGRYWRLYHEDTSYKLDSYYEIDLLSLVLSDNLEDFKYFYNFFRLEAFLSGPDGKSFLDRVREESLAYAKEIGDDLQENVYRAMKVLAEGFLRESANRLITSEADIKEIHDNSLRLLYRLLFIFYAESRSLLKVSNERYRNLSLYKMKTDIAERLDKRETILPFSSGLWARLNDLFRLINEGSESYGIPKGEFYIPPYDGGLFDPKRNPFLTEKKIGDSFLSTAIDLLARSGKGDEKGFVDYSSLEIRHLGSIYEGILEFRLKAAKEDLVTVRENGREIWVSKSKAEIREILDEVQTGSVYLVTDNGERKTSGSYYTHESIVKELVNSALEPVIEKKRKEWDPVGEKSFIDVLLSIKVLDVAMGSAHFLVEATDHLARWLIQAKAMAKPEDKDSQDIAEHDIQWARREVVRNCIYGVDINPMAVELAKLSLWLMTVASKKPLNFLDHHLRCGNSLIGAELRDLGELPGKAKKGSKGHNSESRWMQYVLKQHADGLIRQYAEIAVKEDENLEIVKWKETKYKELRESELSRRLNELANVWVSTYFGNEVIPDDYAELQNNLSVEKHPDWSGFRERDWFKKAQAIAQDIGFFHWELEFPEAFTLEDNGFDINLGNPPWERIKLQEKEFFASRDSEIANAPTAAARRKLIQKLPETNPGLAEEYAVALRKSEGESEFMRKSGRYPLTSGGDINTYAVFAELIRSLMNRNGRAGIVIASGIATDYTYHEFFADIIDKGELVSLYDFENHEGLFPGIHRQYKFSLIVLSRERIKEANFAFFLHKFEDLTDERCFPLSSSDLSLINPNTKTAPILRTRRDAELIKKIYRHANVFVNDITGENLWGISFFRMFDMTNDSHLFYTREQFKETDSIFDGGRIISGDRVYFSLYEGKMIYQFDHRFAHASDQETHISSSSQKTDPTFFVNPRYWIDQAEVSRFSKVGNYSLGFRGITNPENERTAIAAIVPKSGYGNSLPLILPENFSARSLILLTATLNTFVVDWVARTKTPSRNMNFFVMKQLPILSPIHYTPKIVDFIMPRLMELTYTAWDLEPFARDILNEVGEETWNRWIPENPISKMDQRITPFRWDEDRRVILRAELDAIYAHLYGVSRQDLGYILETFPIVKRKDEEKYGIYRTKDLILQYFDRYTGKFVSNGPSRIL